jgi:hypothetical protein
VFGINQTSKSTIPGDNGILTQKNFVSGVLQMGITNSPQAFATSALFDVDHSEQVLSQEPS